MKKALVLCLALALVLCGCSKQVPAETTETTAAPVLDDMDAFDAILYNGGTFWDQVYGEVTLSEYCQEFYKETQQLPVPARAAYVDMNGDGSQELVILDELEDVLVLHGREGRVESQYFPAALVSNLKADGTFRWFGYLGSNGLSILEFSEKCWNLRNVATEDPNEETVYYIDREIFPETQGLPDDEAFRWLGDIQNQKPDAPWFDLTPPKEPAPVLEAYRAVLAGEASFTDAYLNTSLEIDPMTHEISDGFRSTVPTHFCPVDLDADGTQEVILRLREGEDQYAGFWTLRFKNGQVYGYESSYRSYDQLKADGTYKLAVDAWEGGLGRFSFEDESYQYSAKYFADDHTDPVYQYFIDGQPATAEDVEAAYIAHAEKPDAIWYRFTEENIDAYGAGEHGTPALAPGDFGRFDLFELFFMEAARGELPLETDAVLQRAQELGCTIQQREVFTAIWDTTHPNAYLLWFDSGPSQELSFHLTIREARGDYDAIERVAMVSSPGELYTRAHSKLITTVDNPQALVDYMEAEDLWPEEIPVWFFVGMD